MPSHLTVLEEAISDVGYWRWWTDALPDVFQVEFGGVQMHFPPSSPELPPNSVVALRFFNPSAVAFLTEHGSSQSQGWRAELHDDRIQPFAVSHELFTLTSSEVLQTVVSDCAIEYLHGNQFSCLESSSALLAFRSQDVGLVVRAERMVVVAVPGELSAEQIVKASGDWWEYWRRYWDLRESESPLPKDYACEVTFPIK
jgi:hypothetical protein